MMILTTDAPKVRVDKDRVVVSFPSGNTDSVEIVLTVHQATLAGHAMNKAVIEAMRACAVSSSQAEIIAFPKKQRKAGRK